MPIDGTCVNALIDTDVHFEEINAMPHMTAVPVRFAPIMQRASSLNLAETSALGDLHHP